MTTVATSTVNIIGFFIIIRGFSFTNDCFKLSITCSFGNKEADLLSFISSLIQYHKLKCSSNCTQCMYREERQRSNNEDNHKCHDSESQCIRSFNVPAPSGMNSSVPSNPAMATMPDDRNKTTQDQNDTTRIVPEISVIDPSLQNRNRYWRHKKCTHKVAHSNRGIPSCSTIPLHFPQNQGGAHKYNLRVL